MTRGVQSGLFVCLLVTANLAPWVMPGAPGAVIAVSALLGILWMFVAAGALRIRFFMLMVVAALAAVVFGTFR